MANHHLECGGFGGKQAGKSREEGLVIGLAGRMHQECGLMLALAIRARIKQKTVGGAAPLQRIFQFESEPLRTQPPQASESVIDGQADHLPRRCCRGLEVGCCH